MNNFKLSAIGSIAAAVCLLTGPVTSAYAQDNPTPGAYPDAYYNNGYLDTIGQTTTVDLLKNDVPTDGASWKLDTLQFINAETGEPTTSYTETGYRSDGSEGSIATAEIKNGKAYITMYDNVAFNIQYQITDTSGNTFTSNVEVQGMLDETHISKPSAFNLEFQKRDADSKTPLIGADLNGENCTRATINDSWSCTPLENQNWFKHLSPANPGYGIIDATNDITDQRWWSTGTQYENNMSLTPGADKATTCDDALQKVTAHEAAAPQGYDVAPGEVTMCYTEKGWQLQNNTAGAAVTFTNNADAGSVVTFYNTKTKPLPVPVKGTVKDDTASTEYNTSKIIDVLANDTPGDSPFNPASITVAGDGNAVWTVNNGVVTATPKNGYSGTTTATYTVLDQAGNTYSGKILLTVGDKPAPTPTKPATLQADTASTEYNSPTTIDVLANDVAGDYPFDLTTLSVQPSDDSAQWNVNNGKITATPKDGFHGITKAVYSIKDNNGTQYENTITLTVNPKATTNTPVMSTLLPDTYETSYMTEKSMDVLANDKVGSYAFDPTSLTVQGDANAAWSVKNGVITAIPKAGFSGDTLATYTVKDTAGNSYKSTITLSVDKEKTTPPKQLGVITDDTATTLVNTPVMINVLANDKAGDDAFDPNSLTLDNESKDANWTVKNGEVEVTPNKDFTGVTTAKYNVKDVSGKTYNGTITVHVTGTASVPTNTSTPGTNPGTTTNNQPGTTGPTNTPTTNPTTTNDPTTTTNPSGSSLANNNSEPTTPVKDTGSQSNTDNGTTTNNKPINITGPVVQTDKVTNNGDSESMETVTGVMALLGITTGVFATLKRRKTS